MSSSSYRLYKVIGAFLLLIGFISIITEVSHAQSEGTAELKKIIERYTDGKPMSYKIWYHLYKSTDKNELIKKSSALYQRKGEQFYMELMNGVTVIQNNEHTLMVDTKSGYLLLDKAAKTKYKGTNDPLSPILLDSIFTKKKYSITVREGEPGERTLIMKAPELFNKAIYTYDSKTYQILKVTFEFPTEKKPVENTLPISPYMEIFMDELSYDPSLFSLQPYLTLTKEKRAIPTEPYKRYKIINHLVYQSNTHE